MKKCMEYIKKNWLLLAFGILILGILVNDILSQFVWKTGMAFRPNSMYVFYIYVGLFVAAPIGVLEHIFKDKYKDIELKEYKDKCESPKDVGRIILSGVGKLVFAIGSAIGMMILVSKINTKLLENVIDTSKPYILISDFLQLPFAVGLGVIFLFVWMFSKKGLIVRDYADDAVTDFFAAGERARLPFKVKCGIALGAMVVFLMSVCTTTLSYHCVTEEGIVCKHFFMERQYAWEDVKEVSNRVVERGAEVTVLEMKDGHMVILDEMTVEHEAEKLEQNWMEDIA